MNLGEVNMGVHSRVCCHERIRGFRDDLFAEVTRASAFDAVEFEVNPWLISLKGQRNCMHILICTVDGHVYAGILVDVAEVQTRRYNQLSRLEACSNIHMGTAPSSGSPHL